MIKKGQAFTFMYEARNKTTGALVQDGASIHTIKVYYKSGNSWTSTQLSAATPTIVGSDTGIYCCEISNTYTNVDHLCVSVTSSNENVIIPIQQFYPVSLSEIASEVTSGVWDADPEQFNSDTVGEMLSDLAGGGGGNGDGGITASDIKDAVWGAASSSYNSTGTMGALLNSSTPTNVWNYGNSGTTLTNRSLSTTTVGGSTLATGTFPIASDIADAVWGGDASIRQLTSNILGSSGLSLALSGESSTVVEDGDGNQTTISAADIATQVLAGIPNAVWTMTVNGDSYSRMARIADYVWGRDPHDDDRSLTTNVLDTLGNPTLALTTEVDTGTDFDPSTITFPDTTQIATAVWNYGKASGVANKNFRSLSNTAIVSSDGTTSKYIGTLSSSTNTIDAAVWASTDKTLSSADIDDGTTIATTTDIPSIENLTDMLTKIFGVLCHWELDGDDIIVKNDIGDTILTIPTVKDKFGDIIQMDGTSEALP